jgi:DNA replication protein DnaC
MMEQTIHKLHEMKLYAMAEVFRQGCQSSDKANLTTSELVAFMVDAEYDKRKNNRISRLLRQAKLKIPSACIEDFDYTAKRNLRKEMINDILLSDFMANHHNVLISGPTGVGKSYIACALGNMACRRNVAVLYFRVSKFLEYMTAEKAMGNYLKSIEKIGKIPIIILDDLGPDILDKKQRNIMMEIIEERYLTATTIMASQLPLDQWYSVFDEPTIADAIMDRLLHNAHKIELKGDSMRRG